MAFKKGNKHGGKRNPPGGRPTKQEAEVKVMVAAAVRSYIEERLKPLIDKYIKVAETDPATLRHLIERFVPPVRAEAEVQDKYPIIYEVFDANKARDRARLEFKKKQEKRRDH